MNLLSVKNTSVFIKADLMSIGIIRFLKMKTFIEFVMGKVTYDTYMTSMKIIQFLGPPLRPLVHLRPKFFHPLDLGRPISIEHLPPL